MKNKMLHWIRTQTEIQEYHDGTAYKSVSLIQQEMTNVLTTLWDCAFVDGSQATIVPWATELPYWQLLFQENDDEADDYARIGRRHQKEAEGPKEVLCKKRAKCRDVTRAMHRLDIQGARVGGKTVIWLPIAVDCTTY